MANIELDGVNKKIKVDSGDLTLDVPGDIVLDADGGDIVVADGGTNILKVTNSSSDVVLQPQVDAKDIIFKQYDGTTVATVEDNGTFNIPANKLAIGDTAVTSTAAELNILDGVTSTAAELNILDGVTSTAAELNIVDGGTSATSTTIADADRVVLNDNGTMVQAAVTDLKTYIGGGTLVQTGRTVISGGNPSGVDINDCFSSTYDTYMIVIDKVEQTVDSAVISCRLRDSGGSVTASNYKYANRAFDDDGNTESKNANSPDSRFDITNDSDDSSNNAGFNGIMYVHRPHSANEYTRMNTFTSFYNNTANDIRIGIAACSYQNAESHTGIGFNISSGGIRDGGSFTVYGIAYS